MTTNACSRCGTFTAPEVMVDVDGESTCMACAPSRYKASLRAREARVLLASGYGGALLGMLGAAGVLFVGRVALLLSVPAAVASWRALRLLAKQPTLRRELSWHLELVVLASLVGFLLGAAGLVLQFFVRG